MARGDEIMQSFLGHKIIREKYNLSDKDLPKKVHEGLKSKHPIVKIIAIIVRNEEGRAPLLADSLYSAIVKFLNQKNI